MLRAPGTNRSLRAGKGSRSELLCAASGGGEGHRAGQRRRCGVAGQARPGCRSGSTGGVVHFGQSGSAKR